METRLARAYEAPEVLRFFQSYIHAHTEGIYSMEFVCPDGIRAAVYRQQIIAALDNGIVVAALRFYIKKNRETASLYQFAIQEPYRGKRLLAQMLGLLEIPHVLAQCKEDSIFNDYYMKTGWTRIKTERNLTTWSLDNTSKSIMTTSPQGTRLQE